MRWLGIIGICAVVLHAATIAWSARFEPDFFDPFHAISDMGIDGKPYAGAVNLLGFGATGFLIIAFGIGTALTARGSHAGRLAGTALALGGLFFTLAGLFPFPAALHFVAVAGAALFLAAGVATLGPLFARLLGWTILPPLSWLTAAAIAFNLVLIALRVPAPGYFAKVSFAAALLWLFAVSFALLSASNHASVSMRRPQLHPRSPHDPTFTTSAEITSSVPNDLDAKRCATPPRSTFNKF